MKYTDYEIKDTGVTIKIRKVSPLLIQKLQQAHPAPRPPKQEVDYGDGKKRTEENPSHPDHLQALVAHEEMIQEMTQRLLLKRGVEFELTDEMKAEIEELREFYLEEFEQELSEDDKDVWLFYIALGTTDDYQELLSAIYTRNNITEDALEAAKNSFQG